MFFPILKQRLTTIEKPNLRTRTEFPLLFYQIYICALHKIQSIIHLTSLFRLMYLTLGHCVRYKKCKHGRQNPDLHGAHSELKKKKQIRKSVIINYSD